MLSKCKYFVLILIFLKSFFDYYCYCTKDIFSNSFLCSIVYSTGPFLHNRTIEIDRYFDESKVEFEDGLWKSNVNIWISAFDWLDDHTLILADSKQKILITGEFRNNKLFNIHPLNITGDKDFGSLIRSLIVYRKNKLIYLSLPKLKRIDQINLINGNKQTFIKNIEPGHIALDPEGNLVWIHHSCSIWTYKENEQELIPCSNEIINVISIVNHSNTFYLYWFSANGFIWRSDINGNKPHLVASNVFEGVKYSNANFYSIKSISNSNEVIFYTSDSKHHIMRLTYVILNGNEFFSRTKFLFVENNMYDFSLVTSLYSQHKIESEWILNLRSLARKNRLNASNYKVISLSTTNSGLLVIHDNLSANIEFSLTTQDISHPNLISKWNIETYLPISLYTFVIVALIVALIWLATSLVISKERYHRIVEVKRF